MARSLLRPAAKATFPRPTGLCPGGAEYMKRRSEDARI